LVNYKESLNPKFPFLAGWQSQTDGVVWSLCLAPLDKKSKEYAEVWNKTTALAKDGYSCIEKRCRNQKPICQEGNIVPGVE